MLTKEPCKELGIAISEPEHVTNGGNAALLGHVCGGDGGESLSQKVVWRSRTGEGKRVRGSPPKRMKKGGESDLNEDWPI